MSEKKPEDQRISSVPPFGLRMLPALRARIDEAAERTGRSVNAEIITRLENTFEMDSYIPKHNAHPDDNNGPYLSLAGLTEAEINTLELTAAVFRSRGARVVDEINQGQHLSKLALATKEKAEKLLGRGKDRK